MGRAEAPPSAAQGTTTARLHLAGADAFQSVALNGYGREGGREEEEGGGGKGKMPTFPSGGTGMKVALDGRWQQLRRPTKKKPLLPRPSFRMGRRSMRSDAIESSGGDADIKM